MPQTDMGVLLFIGAIFFLIGLLGGGFEISAIKIPSVAKYPRLLSAGIGVIFMAIAVGRLIFPPTAPTVAETYTPVSTSIAVVPSETPISPSSTPVPPTDTPVPKPTNTPRPTNTPLPTPTPTATIDADPTVYDNFNNPAFDGSINQSRWKFHNPQGICNAAQHEGILTITMNSSNNAGECDLFGPQEISGSRLQLLEARLQISSTARHK